MKRVSFFLFFFVVTRFHVTAAKCVVSAHESIEEVTGEDESVFRVRLFIAFEARALLKQKVRPETRACSMREPANSRRTSSRRVASI